jgi:uncharacterized membrane protein YgcG
MDEQMIDLVAGDARLRRRLEAYADARLSPDLVMSSRMRARVLAVAHRQADLGRADSALTVVGGNGVPISKPDADRLARRAGSAGARLRRPLVAMLAAAVVLGGAAGTALAAQAGGALYEPRVWIETLALPSDPSARAIAELERLETRLREADAATRNGDAAGAAAALAAYERITESASETAIATQDEVAVAILGAGVGRNVEVLRALALELPPGAAEAISRAVERAVARALERSETAIERIESAGPAGSDGGNAGNGGNGGSPGGGGADGADKPTKPPTPEPTPRPTKEPDAGPTDPGGAGGQGGGQGNPNEPKRTPKPEPTPKRTPR